jgi:hypothetical protein
MRYFVTVSCLLLTAAPFFQGRTATTGGPPPVAVKFLDLFDRLRTAQEKSAAGEHQLVSFQLSETDVNDYLRYSLKATPRPGLDSVTVKFLAKDAISTLARVDFDAVERWHPGTIPAVLKPILKGKKVISIDCRIRVSDSTVTYTVEKARYEDMTLSPFLVEKMIQILAARQPEKYDTSKPVPLPFGLSKIWTTEHTIQGNN